MGAYFNEKRLSALKAKGGMMLFTIEKADILYKGSILIFPAQNYGQKRAVHINEYRPIGDNKLI